MKIKTNTLMAILAMVFGLTGYGQRPQPQLISSDSIPSFGTFWISFGADTQTLPPFPCPPKNLDAPIYDLGAGQYLVDMSDVDFTGNEQSRSASVFSFFDVPMPGDGEGGEPVPTPAPDTRRNYEKFKSQIFLRLDTNTVALTDTNLYNACFLFPANTNTAPNLQIMSYGAEAVLIKANHFDYSQESRRDFALIVCDSVDKPTWKDIDLFGASDAQDGWLVQGIILRGEVSDPMFIMVTNIAHDCNTFFRAIPYAGPQVQLNGFLPYGTVTGNIALEAIVTDLSGVTNVQFNLDVNGIPARYSFSGSNTITLDTKYNFAGWENVAFKATSKASVYSLMDVPVDNAKLFFDGAKVLPLYFDNDVFLAYASDEASLEVGQNDIDFYAAVPVSYTATISETGSGRVLKSFSGNAPSGYIPLVWNFTEQDGVTPYTNDTYVVAFSATPSGGGSATTLTLTNKIDDGVRPGAGCFLTYQEEDPSDPVGSFLNQSADTWVRQTLRLLYTDQYKSFSLTQYTPGQVGTNRNHANCVPLSNFAPHWTDFMDINLTNKNYSDLTIAQAHGNGYTIGYSKAYLKDTFNTYDLIGWIRTGTTGKNWRLRKSAFWTCYSGYNTGDLSFPQACGIRPMSQQNTAYCRKNAGLFFGGTLPQGWVSGGVNVSTAQAAAFFDQTFMCGKYQYPGGCDPTYSIEWSIRALLGKYPEMNPNGQAEPRLYGFQDLIHTTIYDDELMMLDTSHVKRN